MITILRRGLTPLQFSWWNIIPHRKHTPEEIAAALYFHDFIAVHFLLFFQRWKLHLKQPDSLTENNILVILRHAMVLFTGLGFKL